MQKAYEVWWMDLVILIECEDWNRNPTAIWDYGDAYWLCQMNRRYHKIPQEYYDDWWFQIEYCKDKLRWWTKFYWPKRILPNWKICKEWVLDRFTFIE